MQTDVIQIPSTIALASATHPSLAVRDGNGRTLGHLVRHGDNFEAVGVDVTTSYGVHATMTAAAFALPTNGGDA
jgi:hypothetical protein